MIWHGRCGLPYDLLLTLCERMLLNFVPFFSAWCFGIKSNKVCLEIDWETRELKLDRRDVSWLKWHNFSVNFLVDLVSFGLKFGVSLLSSKRLSDLEHKPPTPGRQELYPDPKTRLKNIRLFPTELETLPEGFELMPLEAGAESGSLPKRTGPKDMGGDGRIVWRGVDIIWRRLFSLWN